MPTNPVRGI